MVHPLKAFTHYADISTCNHLTGEQEVKSPGEMRGTDMAVPKREPLSPRADEFAIGASSPDDAVVMRSKSSATGQHDTGKESRASVTYEGSSDEEESVSVTTGRLSLTLSHSSDKEGAIDVTAATVQKEEVETHLSVKNKSSTTPKKLSNGSVVRLSGNVRHARAQDVWISSQNLIHEK